MHSGLTQARMKGSGLRLRLWPAGRTALHAASLRRAPDDSPLLAEVRETLRMNRAIGEAMEDVREGRTCGAEEFMAKVQQRWPRKASA